MDQVFDVMGMIVGVAMITTLVAHSNTANVVNSFGSAFSSSILAAQGIQ
jgi:hypothetical protein